MGMAGQCRRNFVTANYFVLTLNDAICEIDIDHHGGVQAYLTIPWLLGCVDRLNMRASQGLILALLGLSSKK